MSSKEDIKLSIFKLLHEKGFEKTTFQAIADASGYKKTLVQYHFPQKNQFITQYLDFLISAVMEYALRNRLSFHENGLGFIVRSKIYTHLILHKELIQNVTIHVVKDREILTYMQIFHEQTAIKLLSVDSKYVEELHFLLLFAQGGHFDLIYRMIQGEMKCDVHKLLAQTLITISPALLMSTEDVHRIMNASLEYEDKIQKAVEEIILSINSQIGC